MSSPRVRAHAVCLGFLLIADADADAVQHLPAWFPGAGFKRKAAEWRAKMEEFVDRPYEIVKERMVRPMLPVCADVGLTCATAQRHYGPLLRLDPPRGYPRRKG